MAALVNRQVMEDFIDEPVTADAAIYLVNEGHVRGAAGYHAVNGREVPYGFVFVDRPATTSSGWVSRLSV